MIVNLMDPGLKHRKGHHFDLDLRLARCLVERGHQVRLYANRQLVRSAGEAIGAVAPVMPLFRHSPYENAWEYDPIAGDLMFYSIQSSTRAEDLRQAADADLWIWPSLFAADVMACAAARPRVPIRGCVHVHADWHGRGLDRGKVWWRNSFVQAQRAGIDLTAGCNEPMLQHEYLPLVPNGRFECFPVPYDGAPIAAQKRAMRRIGFFGEQRREKGRDILAHVVPALAALGYEIVVQDGTSETPPVAPRGVETLGYVEDLAMAIATCDIVVLPYHPKLYRSKGSGILWEALASGIPAVAPSGSAPGRWVEKTGAGVVFEKFAPDDILRAITAAGNRYSEISAAAHALSRRWPERHGIAHFADALLR